jgi:hypothetical protein
MKKFAIATSFVLIFAFFAKIEAQTPVKDQELAAAKLELALTQRALLVAQAKELQAALEKAQAELSAKFAKNNADLKALGKDPANYEFSPAKGEFVEKAPAPTKSEEK